MRLIGTALALGVTLAATAGEQSTLAKLWPAGVPVPAGLKLYQKTEHAQNTVILNGFDFHTIVHRDQDTISGVNPNRIFPWAVSGGLHQATGWQSHAAIALPKGKAVTVFNEYIDAGARRPLPVTRWEFPTGTVLADILSVNERTFEIRTLTKTERGWVGRTPFESEHKPAGHVSPHKVTHGQSKSAGGRCFDCHDRAGQWLSYGTLLRGSDSVFSFSPLKPGTLLVRRDLLDAGTVTILENAP